MAAAGSGALADSGCKGPGAWVLRGCGLCFPVLGQVGFCDGPSEKKRRQSNGKQRVFLEGESEPVWQGKCAAFLVGDLGCAYRDHDSADFRLDAAAPRPRHLSVSGRVISNLSLPTCQPAAPSCCPAVCQQSSLVTFLGTVTTANLLWHFLLLAPRPDQPANLILVCLMPGGRGPADKGPTLIIVGNGEGAPDE